ncbi:MAG: hypothetical protein PHT76_09140 [Anaerostipes sp.]|nr:hypothetical protein [Anaerostipes sp.]
MKKAFNNMTKEQERKAISRMVSYQKRYEKQVGRMKTNRNQIRKG